MDAPFGATDDPDEIRAAYEIAAAVRAERQAARRPPVYLHHRNGPADEAVTADALATVRAWRRGEPGSTEGLVDRLTRDDIDVRVLLLRFLSLSPARGFRGRDIAPAVIDCLQHPDPAVSQEAEWLCLKRYVPGARKIALERAAARKAHVAGGDARPFAPAMETPAVRAALRGGSPTRPVEAFIALARQLFDDHSQVVGLGTLAKGTGDDALVTRIIEDYGWEKSHSVQTALLHIGGAAAKRWLLATLPTLDPTGRTELMWALEGLTLDHVLTRCRDADLIAEVPQFITVRRVRYERWGGYDAQEFMLFDPFIDLLVRLGAAVSFNFDPGADVRYDTLIRKFGFCMPWFRLEALSERILRIEGERNEVGRVLQFVASGKRYRLEMDPCYGRYGYTLEIVAMLNRALEDAGREERFLPVRRDERQVFLFARPEVARALASTIYLPVEDEPALVNDAVRRFLDARR